MHNAQQPTWQSVPAPASAASWELGDLLGTSSHSICWGRLMAFFAARVVVVMVTLVVQSLMQRSFSWTLDVWVSNLSGAMLSNVMFTAVALGAFRWMRNPMLAAPLAAVGYTLVMFLPRLVLLLGPGLPEHWRITAHFELNLLAWTLLFLLGLAVAVRWIKPVWAGLLVGAVAGSVLAHAAYPLISLALGGLGEFSLSGTLAEVAYGLGSAVVFAGAFWAALQLRWARLREGPVVAAAYSGPNYHRISKRFFMTSLGVALGMALPLVFAGNMRASSSPKSALLLLAFSSLPLLYCAVVMMVFFYKMWAAIQDGHARTTPGKAIGFMFIPVFNIYWAFQLACGWAKDYNRLVARHGLSVPRLPEGLFLTFVILAFTGWIPVVGILLVSVNYLIGMAMVEKACDGINALPPQLKSTA